MITVVCGAQFGSEGKGAIVGHIAGSYQIHVRVGAANAGHTVYVQGEKKVVQQLPCAAYANPWANLVLGAGAMISPNILTQEIRDNLVWRKAKNLPPLRLKIDRRAHVITEEHIQREQESGLAERIGSTSTVAKEGIGAAQAARVMRTDYQLAEDYARQIEEYNHIEWVDTVEMLHDAKLFDNGILLEGTQGTGLDNVLGYRYPYVTSRHVTAAGILADVGFGPRDADQVIIVARTFPIRVAGPSGPFWPDSREISWNDVGIDPDKEKTTVTKKIRRVATFSYDQIVHAVKVNSATEVALMFGDYLAPEIAGRGGAIGSEEFDRIDFVAPMVRRIEQLTQVPVCLIGTGPSTILNREPGV